MLDILSYLPHMLYFCPIIRYEILYYQQLPALLRNLKDCFSYVNISFPPKFVHQ